MNEKELQAPAAIFFPATAPKKPTPRRRYFEQDAGGVGHEIHKTGPKSWEVEVEPGHDAHFATLKEAKAWIRSSMKPKRNGLEGLEVTGIRYFETRRGVGFEAKTNHPSVVIWNDGNGGGTYVDRWVECSELRKAIDALTEEQLDELLDIYEGVAR